MEIHSRGFTVAQLALSRTLRQDVVYASCKETALLTISPTIIRRDTTHLHLISDFRCNFDASKKHSRGVAAISSNFKCISVILLISRHCNMYAFVISLRINYTILLYYKYIMFCKKSLRNKSLAKTIILYITKLSLYLIIKRI